jgi:hypothetical protein
MSKLRWLARREGRQPVTTFDGAGAGSAGESSSLLFAGGLGIMPVRRVFGLSGADCTGAGEMVGGKPTTVCIR